MFVFLYVFVLAFCVQVCVPIANNKYEQPTNLSSSILSFCTSYSCYFLSFKCKPHTLEAVLCLFVILFADFLFVHACAVFFFRYLDRAFARFPFFMLSVLKISFSSSLPRKKTLGEVTPS